MMTSYHIVRKLYFKCYSILITRLYNVNKKLLLECRRAISFVKHDIVIYVHCVTQIKLYIHVYISNTQRSWELKVDIYNRTSGKVKNYIQK